MLVFKFKMLVFLSVFTGILPIQTMAQEAVIAPAPSVEYITTDKLIIRKQNGEDIPINIKIALTPAEKARGLMFQPAMPKDAGMLFVFDDEAPRSFWMKNTLIPLDIIFIKRNGEILNIHENAIPFDLTAVKSDGNAYAVLEINGGMSAKLGITAGDTINHEYFGMIVPQ